MRKINVLTSIVAVAWLALPNAHAAESDLFKTAGGLAVYLGVLPAAMLRGAGFRVAAGVMSVSPCGRCARRRAPSAWRSWR